MNARQGLIDLADFPAIPSAQIIQQVLSSCFGNGVLPFPLLVNLLFLFLNIVEGFKDLISALPEPRAESVDRVGCHLFSLLSFHFSRKFALRNRWVIPESRCLGGAILMPPGELCAILVFVAICGM